MRQNKVLIRYAVSAVALLALTGAATLLVLERMPAQTPDRIAVEIAPTPAADLIRTQLDANKAAGELRGFYQQRDFAPAWTDENGVKPGTAAILRILQDAPLEGLSSASYPVNPVPRGNNEEARTAFELSLTQALLHYARDLHMGQVDAAAVYGADNVSAPARHYDPLPALTQLADRADAAQFVNALEPAEPEYRSLKTALVHYRTIAAHGGWPAVESASGDALTRRLAAEGYVQPNETDGVKAALRRYQARNGLAVTGLADAPTLKMLNVSAQDRAAQIAANMERWRWLPAELGTRHIMVNVADATLTFIDGADVSLASRVAVGQRDKQTPFIQASVVAVTVNPVWHVPESIIKSELLGKIAKDDGYLASKNMTMTDGRVEQGAGPGNALGTLKLEMPNRLDVYLHDTPSKAAFRAQNRTVSHGCVRVELIRNLAAAALYSDPNDTSRLEDLIATGATSRQPLPAPVPVYFQYWTAVPGDDAVIGFRNDVYNRDAILIRTLEEKSSGSQT